MPSEIDIAWAAGLFEGEGYFCVWERKRQKSKRGIAMGVTITDRDVLDRFVMIVGAGSIRVETPRVSHYKVRYCWRIGAARDVERVIGLFLPHLGQRRSDRARDALAIAAEIKTGAGAYRSSMCARGLHRLSGSNVKAAKNGKRRCRACLNAWRRAACADGRKG